MFNRRIILASLILLGFSTFINAQTKDMSKVDWLAWGFGSGLKEQASAFISYTILEDNAYMIKYGGNDLKFSIFGNGDFLYTASFSYGIVDVSDWFFGGVFMGPSIVFKDYIDEERKTGFGIDICGQYFWAASDVIGFGIDAYSNFNAFENLYGARFSIFLKSIK